MTILNLEAMSNHDLILNYILECRGRGHFLPYQDYQIIDEWIRASPSMDMLLLVLSEILPPFFQKYESRQRFSLKGIEKKVLQRLRDQVLLTH